MFGLFNKKIDDLTLSIWICSAVVIEFDEHQSNNHSFRANNVKKIVNETAKMKNVKLTSRQENNLSLVCGVLTAEFHIDKTADFLDLVETMANQRKSNPNNREPAIQFIEYLGRYGIFLGN